MSAIHEYIVVEPPSSGEVESHAQDLTTNRVFELVIREEREIPKPANEAASFLVRQLVFHDKGGMIISGKGLEENGEMNDSFIVRTDASDPSRPARLHIVRP